MQPPTEPSPQAAERTRSRQRGDEAELYRRYHRQLQRAVARAVSASPELIDDACQTAWTALLRSQPERRSLFAWLRVVAIREAWRQSARARTETPAGGFHTPYACELALGEHPEPPADTRDVAEQVAARIEHTQRLRDLATIKPNDRRTLYLHGLGYRYREIMRLTGASYTAVNRRITEGRRALHELEHDRQDARRTERAASERNAPPPA
jgi:DNA-directed RNA polymerase specialized sigma24 family protein